MRTPIHAPRALKRLFFPALEVTPVAAPPSGVPHRARVPLTSLSRLSGDDDVPVALVVGVTVPERDLGAVLLLEEIVERLSVGVADLFSPSPELVTWGSRLIVASPERTIFPGLTMMIVLQACVNMSVVVALLPTKGIPLPFVSSGGSSLLANFVAMGILLNISQQATAPTGAAPAKRSDWAFRGQEA